MPQLTHPATRIASSIAVSGYANILRKMQPEPAGSTLVQVLASFEQTMNQMQAFLAQLQDFNQDQSGVLGIGTLAMDFAVARQVQYDPAPIQYLAAVGNKVYPLGTWLRINNTSGGSLTMTSTPTVPPGKDGQVIKLVNIAAQSVVVQDAGTLANSGLRLKTSTVTLAQYRVLELNYSVDTASWLQVN